MHWRYNKSKDKEEKERGNETLILEFYRCSIYS